MYDRPSNSDIVTGLRKALCSGLSAQQKIPQNIACLYWCKPMSFPQESCFRTPKGSDWVTGCLKRRPSPYDCRNENPKDMTCPSPRKAHETDQTPRSSSWFHQISFCDGALLTFSFDGLATCTGRRTRPRLSSCHSQDSRKPTAQFCDFLAFPEEKLEASSAETSSDLRLMTPVSSHRGIDFPLLAFTPLQITLSAIAAARRHQNELDRPHVGNRPSTGVDLKIPKKPRNITVERLKRSSSPISVLVKGESLLCAEKEICTTFQGSENVVPEKFFGAFDEPTLKLESLGASALPMRRSTPRFCVWCLTPFNIHGDTK